MRTTSAVAVTLLLSMVIGAEALSACGDKFFMVGRGERFSRAYASLFPGNVLIYAGGTSEISRGLLDARFQKSLTSAGHRVVIVTDRADFDRTLASEPIDLVLAPLGQAGDLVPPTAASVSRPGLLPIEGKGPDARSSVMFPKKLKASDGIGRFLSTIEDAMEARAKTAGRRQG